MIKLRSSENEFYQLLKDSAALVYESSTMLQDAVANPATFEKKMNEIIDIEHNADEVTKAIMVKLHKTLVTPMDREDLYMLATILDDIVDFVQGAIERMVMYKATEASHGAQELVNLLHGCIGTIKEAINHLSNVQGNVKEILSYADRISDLESEGDRLYRKEVGKLFEEETNPIEIIKWKEILEHLEDALDRCEDLSNTIKGVVLKYA